MTHFLRDLMSPPDEARRVAVIAACIVAVGLHTAFVCVLVTPFAVLHLIGEARGITQAIRRRREIRHLERVVHGHG